MHRRMYYTRDDIRFELSKAFRNSGNNKCQQSIYDLKGNLISVSGCYKLKTYTVENTKKKVYS